MHEHRKSPHDKLQRRFLIGVIIVALVSALIAIPLIVNDELRYDLSMRSGQIPGQGVEKLAEGDDGVLLIVIPLDHDVPGVPTPWLFRAQFLAWPIDGGQELENVESGERVNIPLKEIEFISANADGSLIMMRGEDSTSGDVTSLTVDPATMAVETLGGAEAVPDVPGDWETSIWSKQGQRCHRPSPNQRLLICFSNPELKSYFAGDWELNVQYWGNFKEQHPIFRGMGFLPITGFAHDDSVVYFQNENGVWRADVPQDVLDNAPEASPVGTPQPETSKSSKKRTI